MNLKMAVASSAVIFFLLMAESPLRAEGPAGLKKTDRCPVCGMFVSKYPKWVARIVFKDGSYAVFDGAKDMFKYYFNIRKYNPGKTAADIDGIYVTDYYSVELMDAKKALFVTGSNVYGPMGHELVPFKDEPSALEFKDDHKGKSILTFPKVTEEVVTGLDKR